MTASAPTVWEDAALAAALLALDPVGLGGIVLRAGPGSARDRWIVLLRVLLTQGAPVRRIPPHIEDDRLLGGLDLAASLAAGRPIAQRGILAECDGGVAVISMAERLDAGVATRLGQVLDRGRVAIERDGLTLNLDARIGLVALDEGCTPGEAAPASLVERLAFHVDLATVDGREPFNADWNAPAMTHARDLLAQFECVPEAISEAICAAAQGLGVSSARAPLFTLRAARAHAALHGRRAIITEDIAAAARLVLAPRALALPADVSKDGAPDNDPSETARDDRARDDPQNETTDEPSQSASESDMVVAAIKAALPDDLLARIVTDNQARHASARVRGSGSAAKSANRGRPLGSRGGALRAGGRLNLVDTLRAAAPWQTFRREGAPIRRIQVRREDFRIRRFVSRLESTTIFVVDASGSTAFQRLAEAKGAVELLLVKAYVSRSQVALIAFRGAGAEVLLPPTRSLARAKNRLAELPGGGGTPLAAGVDAALLLAQAELAKNHTPLLVFLTDGRANVGNDPAAGRVGAEADAIAAAERVAEARVSAVYVDTSPRARPDGNRFAAAMGAVYAPLPYLDASAVADLVGQVGASER